MDEDEGASCFLAHTSSLKRLRLILGDPGRSGSPPESEEPLDLVRPLAGHLVRPSVCEFQEIGHIPDWGCVKT